MISNHYEEMHEVDSQEAASLSKESMSHASEAEKSKSLWAAIRRYPKITAYTFSLTFGIILWGYDLVIVSTVASIPAFQKVFGSEIHDRWFIPVSWLALWAISTNIGLMVGSVFFGWLQDRIGRRWSLAIGSLICSAAVAMCYVSDLPPTIGARRGLFFAAKTVQGFAVGGMMCTIQTWISEVLPTDLRGPLMAIFPIFKLLGQLAGALACLSVIESSSKSSYRLCLATQWAFSIPLTFVAILLPESPAWELRRRSETAARKALIRLHTGGVGDQAEREFCRIRGAIELERQDHLEKESYLDCFKKVQRRRTAIVCFAEFIPLLFGLQLLGSASYFLQQIGMNAQPSLLFQVVGIAIGTVASCITFYTLSKFGRRILIWLSLAVISLLWGSIGISGIWQNDGAMWYTGIGMMMVIFTAGFGAWPAAYAVASEASALRLRAKTQGLGWFMYGLGTLVFGLIMPYLYNPDAANIGSKTAFVYFGIAGIGAVTAFFYIPEMKGRSAQEIEKMFSLGVPTRKFRDWSDEDEGRV